MCLCVVAWHSQRFLIFRGNEARCDFWHPFLTADLIFSYFYFFSVFWFIFIVARDHWFRRDLTVSTVLNFLVSFYFWHETRGVRQSFHCRRELCSLFGLSRELPSKVVQRFSCKKTGSSVGTVEIALRTFRHSARLDRGYLADPSLQKAQTLLVP